MLRSGSWESSLLSYERIGVLSSQSNLSTTGRLHITRARFFLTPAKRPCERLKEFHSRAISIAPNSVSLHEVCHSSWRTAGVHDRALQAVGARTVAVRQAVHAETLYFFIVDGQLRVTVKGWDPSGG